MIPERTHTEEEDLVALMDECSEDPLLFVQVAFDWGYGELKNYDGPDQWQIDVLTDLRDGLIDIAEAIRLAVASGHGIGKSALVAWIILWAISTMTDARGVVTANTDTQLRTKTWPELTKWYRRCLTSHWFKCTATSIFSLDKDREKTWRFDMIPWSESNPEAFAGLHNEGKRIVVIFDEASRIHDLIWEVTEGALTDDDTQIIWAVFGNPTRNTGRFKQCFTKYRHRWSTRQIDSRTVKITNKKQIQEWLEDYGENSDFFKVRVRGVFPSMSVKQFISVDDVDAALGRHLKKTQYKFAPKIIGVDPAWSGDDDFVIYFRQGLYSKVLGKYSKNDNDIEMANIIARFEDEYKADAVFVDAGYGTGIVSAGTTMGRSWILVWFGGGSTDAGCLNKRAEMWNEMKKWLKQGGAIENDDTIYEDLIGPETVPRFDGKIQLESKEDMKKRGLASPNHADALALTFAQPVVNNETQVQGPVKKVQHDFDPYNQSDEQQDYDPYQ